jgi:hypothetical protein
VAGWLAIAFVVGAVAVIGLLFYLVDMASAAEENDQNERPFTRTPFDPPPF